MAKLSPFDYSNSITTSKEYMYESGEGYSQFMINKALSYQKDCLPFAEMMNSAYELTDKMHYDFLFHIVPKNNNRRYSKWQKAVKDEDVRLIQEVYGCNQKIALQYLSLLNNEGLEKLKESLFRGGRDVKP